MRTYNANDACLIYQPAETIDRGLPMDDLGPARTGAERQTAVNVYRLPVSALQGASASSQDDRMRRSDSPATPRFPGTRGTLRWCCHPACPEHGLDAGGCCGLGFSALSTLLPATLPLLWLPQCETMGWAQNHAR